MSNAQPDTRGAGGERRRHRSRGGRGRNRNRQNDGNENRGERGDRGERNHNRGERGERGDRNQSRGDRGERGPRPPRKDYKPVKLTLWQKILKAIGLYKEPVRPPRPERKESVRFEEGPPSGAPTGLPAGVKSNTRNARQGGGEGQPPKKERGERGERQDRGDRGERRNQERGEVSGSRIYLGNLSYDSTEEDLKDLFKGVGTVRNVEIVYNRRTHKSKGYGFVDMLNVDEAKRSVEVLHDQFFMGRKLVVSGAKSKEHEDAVREEMVEREPRPVAQAAAVATPVVAAAAAAPVVEEAITAPAEEAAPAPAAPAVEAAAEEEQPPTA
ncbi:hypothetical protein OJ996_11420 [Luteolibacter sp. GHJ8]|uniref:RRM domain-containing protein n=1 Tax=Luteolibacter rhizosphaerae TaxID=2989719 RepID=A0ABT3G2W5_9BACT|nr:hypothetical protein [Luteolibacter rhizosphaerae]MCW1914188.1 hypothetical protein [Luteolibacter rhizosphaerae]